MSDTHLQNLEKAMNIAYEAGEMDKATIMAQEIQAYQKASGRQDWPIAPFILERLFSIWINDKNFKVIPL